MTTLYFIFCVLYALGVFLIYKPFYRYPFLASLSAMPGWLVAELALHHIALQVIVTYVFFALGAINGVLGITSFCIFLFTCTALAYHYYSGRKAGEEVESALIDALGQDYKDHIIDSLTPCMEGKLEISQIICPLPMNMRGVKRIQNIVYDKQWGCKLRLDIYKSHNDLTHCPILFQIHGGGWMQGVGSKDDQARPLMHHLARQGWVCVSVEYRRSPLHALPTHLIDCKRALAWVKQHITEYGGDPNFIITTGGSAGGHLCSLLALTAHDKSLQPKFEDADTTVQGTVPFYGIYDFTDENGLHNHNATIPFLEKMVMQKKLSRDKEAFRQMSPLHRIHANAPPFFIIQGACDTIVSVKEARFFAKTLKNISHHPVGYAEIHGAQHAFDAFASLRSEHVKLGVERFITHLYSDYLKNRFQPPPINNFPLGQNML